MFYLAVVLGLTGSLHCVGMCGPVALALPVHNRSAAGKFLGIILYNLGRISVYSLFGLLTGSIGFLAGIGDWQRWLSVAAGVLLLSGAVGTNKWWENLPQPAIFRTAYAAVSRYIRQRLPKQGFGLMAAMGMLNGLLPCGMVYLALLSAVAAPDSLSGALYMASFGFGTLPAMLATGFMGQWASVKWRLAFRKATPYLVAFAGVVLIIRGLYPSHGHHHQRDSNPIPICVGE